MKTKATFITLLIVLSLSLAVIPNVHSQPENIKVVNYSWYIDSLGFFVVVGEIQNTGSNTVQQVGISGTVYSVDGAALSDSYTQAYVKYLVPQQKAVFYMEFSPTNDATGETWIYLAIDHVDFTVIEANETSSYQYPDLTVKTSSAAIGSSQNDQGVYWVSGTVQNTGNQTAKNIRVIGSFYNASGTVIAMGYTDPITILNPSQTASFKVGAFDLNQSAVPSDLKIASYSLLIQTEEPILSGTPPPASTTNQTDTSPSSTEPSGTNPTNSDSTPWSTYAIVAVVVVFAVVGSVSLFRYRKSQAEKKRQVQLQRKPRTGKKKR